MILYEEIQNNQQIKNTENFSLLLQTLPETLGPVLISLCTGIENYHCKHTNLLCKITNDKLDSLTHLATQISPNTLFKIFEVFEKELKANIFAKAYKENLHYEIFNERLIVDKTQAPPFNLAQQIENMNLLEILTSEDKVIFKAGISLLEQIGFLAGNYDMIEVLKNNDAIEYVKEDIKANIIQKRPNISQENRDKQVELVNRFGLDNYEEILTNLNTLWDYICNLQDSNAVQQLIYNFQNLRHNFNHWPSEDIINTAHQLFNDYKKENARQLIESLSLISDGELINSKQDGHILVTFISRDDEFQKKQEEEFSTFEANKENISRFLNKDAFERQIERENFLSFEWCDSLMYITNNSNVISAGYFNINHITPHLNRKVAFGYSSKALNPNSFLAISPQYLPINSRENFKNIATPYTQIVSSSTRTNELLLDATNIGAPDYIMYVQSTPKLDTSDPDYQWACELAQKHNLSFVVYNDFLMKLETDLTL